MMDHAPALGPVKGLEDPRDTVDKIAKASPSAIMLHGNIFRKTYEYFLQNNIPFILKLTATTTLEIIEYPEKSFILTDTLVDDVESAVKLGAVGVAIRASIGPKIGLDMLKIFKTVTKSCEEWGMPLLAMVYPENVSNPYDPKNVKHAARLAAELGADIVKTYYTGSKETFSEVIDTCPVPVLMSGGPKTKTPREFLQKVKDVMEAGAAGVAVGRNVWQAERPDLMLKAIKLIVIDGKDVEEAEKYLRGEKGE